MTSTHSNSSFTDDYIKLVSGDFSTTLLPSPSTTANITFNFPNSTGATGSYLTHSAVGNGLTWGLTADLRYALPTPRDDYYRCRTNQVLSISVVTGSGVNTGGTDIGGKNPLGSSTRAINSITILKNVSRGLLVQGGSVGGFTYQSLPRFVGRDYFSYSVRDTSGVTGGLIGTCTIDVVGIGVTNTAGGITGVSFVFSNGGTIQGFHNGVGGPSVFNPGFTPNQHATNRDDNVVYYTSNAGSTNMYLWDYVRGVSAIVDTSIYRPAVTATFGSWAATYRNKTLFTCDQANNAILKFTMSPYSITGAIGSQKVIAVCSLFKPVSYTGGGDMFYDIPSSTIMLNGGSTTAPLDIFCPTSSYSYRSTFANLGSNSSQSCLGYNNEFLAAGSTTYRVINKFTLAVASTTSSGVNGINDMSDYVNDPAT